MTEEDSDLECPICYNLMEPPIFQCKVGHIICANCAPNILKCPQCRVDINPNDPIRCLILEKNARMVNRKCKNSKLGCNVIMPLEELRKHERICQFGALMCARVYMYDKKCNWKGSSDDMDEHLIQQHKSHAATPLKLNKTVRRTLRVLHMDDTAPWPIKILKLDGKTSIYVGSVITNGAFFAFCRAATENVKYLYTARAIGKDRSFTYVGPVQPLGYTPAAETKALDCLYVSPEALKLIMTDEPRKLALEITITDYKLSNIIDADE